MDVVVRIDRKGHILIPRKIKEALGIKERQPIRVNVVGNKIVLTPLKDIEDVYYNSIEVGLGLL